MTRPPRRRAPASGFTLLEVLITLLVAMIGLMGTVAIQQTMLNASAVSNDQGIAMRLAMEKYEEFSAYQTKQIGPTNTQPSDILDMLGGFPPGGPSPPPPGIVSLTWSPPHYLDSEGRDCGTVMSLGCRFRYEWRVTINGTNVATVGAPYDIQVKLTYLLDSGASKIVEIDGERRKSW